MAVVLWSLNVLKLTSFKDLQEVYTVFDCFNDGRPAEAAKGVMALVGPVKIFVEPAEDFVEPDGTFLEPPREFGEPRGAGVEPLEVFVDLLGFCGTSRGFGVNSKSICETSGGFWNLLRLR